MFKDSLSYAHNEFLTGAMLFASALKKMLGFASLHTLKSDLLRI